MFYFSVTGDIFINGFKADVTDGKVVNPVGGTVGYLYSLNDKVKLGASFGYSTGGVLLENSTFKSEITAGSRLSLDAEYSFYNNGALSIFGFAGLGYSIREIEDSSASAFDADDLDDLLKAYGLDKGKDKVDNAGEKIAKPISGSDYLYYVNHKNTLPDGTKCVGIKANAGGGTCTTIQAGYTIKGNTLIIVDKKGNGTKKTVSGSEKKTTDASALAYSLGLGANYSFNKNLGALVKVGYYGSAEPSDVKGLKANSVGVNVGLTYKF